MPDLSKILKQHSEKVQSEKLQGETQSKEDYDNRSNKKLNTFIAENAPSTSGKDLLTPEEQQTKADNLAMDSVAPVAGQIAPEQEGDPEARGMDKMAKNFPEEVAKNFIAGIGENVIGSTGKTINLLGAFTGLNSYYEGNWMGEKLNEWGTQLTEAYGTTMPEELQDPNMNVETFTNPRFWSTQVVKYIPQLIEFILLSKGAGAGAKKLTNTIGRNLNKTKAGGLYKKYGRTTLKGKSEAAEKGAKEVAYELEGSGVGLAGKTVRDTGELTNAAANVVETVGAGIGGNMMAGLLNAADSYQELADVTDEYGNPVYTEEELAEVAAGTFTNNMKYIPVDVLSWGMTFGKGREIMKSMGLGRATKGAQKMAGKSSQAIQKEVSKSFALNQGNMFVGLSKFGMKAGREGLEESFQEVWEDWSMMKAKEDALGTPPEYETYWDYYNSKESEATRAISAALGGLGGGAAAIINRTNENAERSRQLWDKQTNLKTLFQEGDEEGKIMEKMHQRQMIEDAVLNDKVDQVTEFIDQQMVDGKLTEEQADEYKEMLEDYQELDEQADVLNVRGKNALFRNHTTDAYLTNVLEDKYNDLQEQYALIDADENLTDVQKQNEKIKRQMKYDRDTKGIRFGISQARANKANLIIGKPADQVVNVKWDISKDGDIVAKVGLSQSDYKLYVQESDEDILSGKSKNPARFGNLPKILSGKAKSVYANIRESLFPSEEATDENQEEGSEEGDNADVEGQDTEGATDGDTTTDEGDSEGVSEESEDTLETRSKLSPEEQEQYDELLSDRQAADELIGTTGEKITKAQQAIDDGKIAEEDKGRAQEIIKGLQKNVEQATEQRKAVQKDIDSFNKKAAKRKKAPDAEADPNLDENAPKTFKGAKDADKLNPSVAEKIANKIKEGLKLSKDQQQIVDKFSGTFDKLTGQAAELKNEFVDYIVSDEFQGKVKKAQKKAKKKAKSAGKKAADTGNKYWNTPLMKSIRQTTANAIGAYSPSEDLFKGKEARTDEPLTESELVDSLKEQSTNFVEGIGMYKYGPANVDIMMATNERMATVFPKMANRPRVIILDNLRKAIGIRGVGYTAGALIYVQRNKWNQGKVFMHEMAHVFYALAKDEPQTKAIIKEALANKKLLDTVLKRYPDHVIYNWTAPDGTVVKGQIDPEYYGKNAKQLADMNVEVAPLEEQDAILEEMFVHYLQGPLSKKYNNFFSPRTEYKRQKLVTKWWNPIATRIEENKAEMDQLNLLNKLEDGKPMESEDFSQDNMRDYIVQRFKDEVGDIPENEIGYEARIRDYDAATIEDKAVINEEWRDQYESFEKSVFDNNNALFKHSEPFGDLLEDEITEEVGKDGTDNPVINILDKTFMTNKSKASSVLREFIKNYNKAIRIRKAHGISDIAFDRKEFTYQIYEMARYAPDTLTFIKMIQDSEYPAVIAFNEFLKLKAKGQDKVILSGIKLVMGNFEMVNAINSVIVNVGNKRKHQLREALSTSEQSMQQNMMAQMKKAVDHFNQKDEHPAGDRWDAFKKIVDRIEKNDETPEDHIQAWRFISGGNVKLMKILDYNRMNYRGSNYTPATILKSFIQAGRHKGKGGTVYVYNFAPLTRILAVTNRAFTQDSLVQNAKNNTVPVRITNNHMTKELNMMVQDLIPDANGRVMQKPLFMKRYSNVTGKVDKRKAAGNLWLSNFYDSVANGVIPSVVYYTGLDDRVSNKGKTFDESTAYEQAQEDFMFFAQDYGRKTYLQNMGMVGDSPRKFYIPSIRHKAESVFAGGKISPRSKVVKSVYAIYQKSVDSPVKIEEFAKQLENDIKKEVAFINSNSQELQKIDNLKDYFTKGGKLNQKGKKMVAEYALNTTLNGYYLTEVFSPNISLKQVDKRLKNSASPVYSVNKKLKFQPVIYVEDDVKLDTNNPERIDGGMYILEKHANAWRNTGLGIFDLNNGFKFLNYSVEKDNPNFAGQTMLLKGYTTILNEAEVAKNPKLKPIYDSLQEQDSQYEAWHTKKHGVAPTNVFSDGAPNSFPIAIPTSAIKDSPVYNKYNQEIPSLSELNEEAGKKFQQDTMYKNGEFMGMNGYNFGPQQVMDQETVDVTLPVQQVNSAIVFAGLSNNHMKAAEDIQALYSAEMKSTLSKVLKKIERGEGLQGYQKFLNSVIDRNLVDPVQMDMIERYGINSPRAHQLVVNTLANQIKFSGNKLKVPGTYAHQKADYGFEHEQVVGGNKDLKGYTEGTEYTKPAEIVMPMRYESKGIAKREYIGPGTETGKNALAMHTKAHLSSPVGETSSTVNKSPLEIYKDIAALRIATMQRTGKIPKNMYKDADGNVVPPHYTDENENVIGYYVPGETVLATRVPSNGPSFTGVFEVVDFSAVAGNQVQVPFEFTDTIGADLDGDALFVQHKGTNRNINKAMDKTIDLWMSPDMHQAITTRMETKADGDKLVKEVNSRYAMIDGHDYKALPFTPEARRASYENNMVAKRNIGIIFNLHRTANTLAAYETNVSEPISIDGIAYGGFMDLAKGKDGRNYKSSLLANMILDNAKHNHADALNINEHTVSAFGLLVNMNVPIEDVATIMNSPIVKEYVNIQNENNSAYNGYTKKGDILKELTKRNIKGRNGKTITYIPKASSQIVTDTSKDSFWTDANQSAIIQLMNKLDRINGEVQSISKIMAGHTGIETNPHLLEKQLEEFNTIMQNDKIYLTGNKNQALRIPAKLRDNPDISRYKATAEATLNETKELDLVYRPVITELFKKLGLSMSEDGLMPNQIKKYSQTVQQFLYSQINGNNKLSPEYFKSLISGPNSVYNALKDYMGELEYQGNLESNMLLTRGLSKALTSSTPYIRLNRNFWDDSIPKTDMIRMRKEFEALPIDLQFKLMNYDLLTNRWDSSYSLLPAMGDWINNMVIENLNKDFKSQKTEQWNKQAINELERIIVAKDFTGSRNNFQRLGLKANTRGAWTRAVRSNPFIAQRILDNKPFYAVVTNPQLKNGKATGKTSRRLMYFPGLKSPSYSTDKEDRLILNTQQIWDQNALSPVDTEGNLDIQLLTINPEGGTVMPDGPLVKKNSIPEGKQAIEEYWRYDNPAPLTRSGFDEAMEFTSYDKDSRKERLYNEYVDQKVEAERLWNEEFKGKDFSQPTTESLYQWYNKYAKKNPYAYSRITTPIIKELAKREAGKQFELTGKQQTSDDINTMQKWFMANNIPSNHPAAQAFVRQIEAEHKRFMGEKKKYAENINNVTDALYKSVFGFSTKSYNPIGIVKRLYYSLFFDRKQLYNRLYGPLVNRIDTVKDGVPTVEYALKDSNEIKKGIDSGIISPEQKAFYDVFKNVTNELAPYSSNKGKLRKNYIPHVNMSNFESFSNRGLLGLMAYSKPMDEKIKDVKMYMKNPETDKQELMSFQDITNIYKALSAIKGNDLSKAKEFILLKRKAKKLLNKHQNEDGSNLVHTPMEIDSALEFGMMNRFTKQRSLSAEELPSMDLNHALLTYTHATLFVNGNQNFKGMKNLGTLLDGVMAVNESLGLKNMNKFLKINWRDAYLKGQKPITFNKPVDNAIDLLTKLNLFAQLGGKVWYTAGNVIAGKYHNIKNESPKEWIKGEKRFWGMDKVNDPWNIPSRIKRVQQILKTINFLDINIYDNVSFQNKNRLDNFLGDIALAPMAWSEKWIQSVQILGLLTEEEWNRFDDKGFYKEGETHIPMERITELENRVKRSQGKGYQMTDQRLIQQYSMGRMFMQFARFIPTIFHDRFAKEDIDIYGKKHIGTMRMLFKTVREVHSMRPADYVRYRKELQENDPELAKRLDSALKGVALSSLAGAFAINNNSRMSEQAYWDANYWWNYDKLKYKTVPSAVRSTENFLKDIF